MLTMGFAACSDDDVTSPSNVDETSVAYMNMNIITSEDVSTRADGDIDPTLSQGVANEHKVSKVSFYFFDAKKNFISDYTVDETTFTDSKDESKNIESEAHGIVAIPRYDEFNQPKYLITVLNPQEQISCSTMEDFYDLADGTFKLPTGVDEKTEDSKKYSIGAHDSNEFVMSTSAYIHDDGSVSYATDLEGANFYKTKKLAEAAKAEAEASNNYSSFTTVYVERLAAKVGLDFSDAVKAVWTAGKVPEKAFNLGWFDLNNTGEKNTQLYAQFIGWGLDGTAKETYYSKHIDSTWDQYFLGTNIPWNDVTRLRSYWAQSCYYTSTIETKKDFPEKYVNKASKVDGDTYSVRVTDESTNTTETKTYYKGWSLNFISANETNAEFGTPLYCGENTNSSTFLSATNLNKNIYGVITCALLYAQLKKVDANGNLIDSGDIVKFTGHYYDATVLAGKFLDVLKSNGYAKYKATADAEEAIDLEAKDLSYVKADDLNGRVEIELNSTIPADAKWYDKDGTEMASLTTETANALLDLTQGENPMVMYKNGRMYYYTPIYHLSSKSIANDVIPEGYYGVVRNHWYGLTITGFRKSKDDDPYNPSDPTGDDPTGKEPYGPEGPGKDDDPIDPGHGVDDPDEPIVPTKEDDINYYIGVNINVLSWRVVNQHIKL
jgi:hypothetical protein